MLIESRGRNQHILDWTQHERKRRADPIFRMMLLILGLSPDLDVEPKRFRIKRLPIQPDLAVRILT
jgi:hypothetical protein